MEDSKFAEKVRKYLASYERLEKSRDDREISNESYPPLREKLQGILRNIRRENQESVDRMLDALPDEPDRALGEVDVLEKRKKLQDLRHHLGTIDDEEYRKLLMRKYGSPQDPASHQPAKQVLEGTTPMAKIPKWSMIALGAGLMSTVLAGIIEKSPVSVVSGIVNMAVLCLALGAAIYAVCLVLKFQRSGLESTLTFTLGASGAITVVNSIISVILYYSLMSSMSGTTDVQSLMTNIWGALGRILVYVIAMLIMDIGIYVYLIRAVYKESTLKTLAGAVIGMVIGLILLVVLSLVVGILMSPVYMLLGANTPKAIPSIGAMNQGFPQAGGLAAAGIAAQPSPAQVDANARAGGGPQDDTQGNERRNETERYIYSIGPLGASFSDKGGTTLQDCETIPADVKNMCLGDVAERLKDKDICAKIDPKDDFWKNNCYSKLAKVLRDASVCDSIEGKFWKDSCVKGVPMTESTQDERHKFTLSN
jgi:hypothetical protein